MDPSRPAVHLTADSGWINDPLSPLWDGERYHLWFQYVPGSTTWRVECHWGHATSTDLMHWTERPVALAPGEGDDGVWSGSVIALEGGHRAFYTSVDADRPAIGRVRLADCADPPLGEWVKGPVVAEEPHLPEGPFVTDFRDPFVWREGGYRMLVGGSLGGTAGVALAYSSPDASTWTFDGVAASRSSDAAPEGDPAWTGSLWECPQVIEVDGEWVLLVSVWHDDRLLHLAASVVDRDGARLVPRAWQRLTVGEGYYAAASFRDAADQPCLIFWIRGLLDPDAGRAGALSVPHRLSVVDGRVTLALHPALDEATVGPSERGDANATLLDPIDLAVEPVIVSDAEGRDRLRLTASAGEVVVTLDGAETRLLAPADGVRVLLDGPVVEVSTRGEATAATLPGAVMWGDLAGARARWMR